MIRGLMKSLELPRRCYEDFPINSHHPKDKQIAYDCTHDFRRFISMSSPCTCHKEKPCFYNASVPHPTIKISVILAQTAYTFTLIPHPPKPILTFFVIFFHHQSHFWNTTWALLELGNGWGDYSGAPAARRAAKRSPIGIMRKKRKPMSWFSDGYHG